MSEQMRAVLIKDDKGPKEALYLAATARPAPAAGEVLVKIKFFGLNRMDISQREGKYPVPAGASAILGVEFSGTVARVGPGVAQWAEGDEVFGLATGGAYAEYIVAWEDNLLRKPPALSWAEAASVPENFLTAFQALVVIAGVQRGDDVLVHAGASGVGVAAIQLARFYGARTVTATASTQDKLDWLLALPGGATHAVNYRTGDFAAAVKAATGGKGADVVIDFVGRSHWHGNVDALAVDGRMTLLAVLSGAEVEGMSLLPVLYKRLRIQGSTLRARPAAYQAQLIARFRDEALGALTGADGAGALRTYIHKVYPWTEIQEAHGEMEANANSGKIIVEVV